MKDPLVSILTPSFEQGRYLRHCLISVARQSYPHVEHIVVDGGSTDESVRLLQDATHSLRWTSERDEGQSDALQKALSMSKGDIIGWVNSDDGYADRRAVEWAVAAFHDRNAVAVGGPAVLINEDNEVLQVIGSLPFNLGLVRVAHYPVQPSYFFRREWLLRVGFVDPRLHYVMDRDLMLRLGSESVAWIQSPVAVDRLQRSRKVGHPEFNDEFQSYEDSHGRPARPRAHRLEAGTIRLVSRLMGTPPALGLATRMVPAMDFVVPPSYERLRRQLFVRRARMAFASP